MHRNRLDMTSLTIQAVFFAVFLSLNWRGVASNRSSSQVTSNAVKCGDPGRPENGFREDTLTSFSPGMQVIFSCEFTYKMIGSQTRTCLSNGTWTGQQPVCKKFMCDELDAMPPKDGKRKGKKFTFGAKLTFKCSRKYKLKGESEVTCLNSGKWSAAPPTCEHICKEVKCGPGKKCILRKRIPKCVCRRNLDCSSNLAPVCGSNAKTYNSECIMEATACRKRKNIQKVHSGPCVPGDLCSIVPRSKCRASFNRFYYDQNQKRCVNIIVGGCHPSGWNGFRYKKDCQKECERDICTLKPERGPCDKRVRRWYFDSVNGSCLKFEYGGCFGNPNNFKTKKDCKKRCP